MSTVVYSIWSRPSTHTSLVWSSNVHCKEEDTSLALKRTVLESCYKICVRQKGPQGALVWPSNKLKYYIIYKESYYKRTTVVI